MCTCACMGDADVFKAVLVTHLCPSFIITTVSSCTITCTASTTLWFFWLIFRCWRFWILWILGFWFWFLAAWCWFGKPFVPVGWLHVGLIICRVSISSIIPSMLSQLCVKNSNLSLHYYYEKTYKSIMPMNGKQGNYGLVVEYGLPMY